MTQMMPAPVSRVRRALSARALRRACALAALATAASLVPSLAAAQPESQPPVAPATPTAPEPVTPAPVTPAPVAEPPIPTEASPPCLPPLTTMAPPEPPSRAPDGTERTLNHHVFIFPSTVRSSIVTTYFGLRIRLGMDSVSGLPTPADITQIEALTLAEGLDLGIKITDWLGVYMTAGARSLVGTNLRALTYAGATYDVGASGGAILRLYRNDETGSQLSLRAGGSYSRGQVSTLFPLLEMPVLSIVEAFRGDLGEAIKTPFTTSTLEGSVAFAQSISRVFGVQASAAVGRGSVTLEPYNRRERTRDSQSADDITYAFGVAPSVDFEPLGAPIAVMPEYTFQRQPGAGQLRGVEDFDTVHVLALGLYYSGRVNLQVGLIGGTQFGTTPLITQVGTSEAPKRYTGEFVLRYVW